MQIQMQNPIAPGKDFSIITEINLFPLYRPVPPALDSPFYRPLPPALDSHSQRPQTASTTTAIANRHHTTPFESVIYT